MAMNNLFNKNSGKKLTPLQLRIVIIVNWIELVVPRLLTLCIYISILYCILHFVIKYW